MSFLTYQLGFGAHPPQWAAPPLALPPWPAFKELMLGFYDRAGYQGVTVCPTGQPTAGPGVTYKQFVEEFKDKHSHHVCVICGGHLGKPQVDHWVWKADYPIFSIAPDNLLPMCHQCNDPPGKGTQPVFATRRRPSISRLVPSAHHCSVILGSRCGTTNEAWGRGHCIDPSRQSTHVEPRQIGEVIGPLDWRVQGGIPK